MPHILLIKNLKLHLKINNSLTLINEEYSFFKLYGRETFSEFI